MALLPPKPVVNQEVQPKRTGTGFTNINKVLNANQGNKLGSSVAGSVQNQAQNVKTQTQQSQQNFETDAEKNRLDTDEAKQKVDNVIGRFGQSGNSAVEGTNQVVNQVANATTQNLNANSNAQLQADLNKNQIAAPSGKQQTTQQPVAQQSGVQEAQPQTQQPADPYAVDMSKFQISQDLQNRYDQKKQDFISQQQAQQAETEKQKAAIQARIDEDTAAYNAIKDSIGMKRITNSSKIAGLKQSIATLKNVLGAYDNASKSKADELSSFLTNLDSDFQKESDAQRNAFQEAERDKLIMANMPTDQEIQDFSKYRAGAYNGPTELGDYQTLLGNASEAQTLGDLTRSSGGRQELLRRFVGGQDYTQGQQKLDNLLLGQDQQGLGTARKSTQGLADTVSDANSMAKTKAQELANRAKIFGEETTQKLNNAKNPIDTKVNENLAKLQNEDQKRKDYLKTLQDTFSGTNESTKGLDRVAQLGIGLQSALDQGYLTQEQANQLIGNGGLVQRAEQLGLNTNQLVNERLQDIAAQNLNRGGAASAAQEAQLSALDRLLGKQGTDVEFNQQGADYQKGGIGLNLDSLNDYITKSEAERAQKDPAYAEQLAQMQPTYLQQMAGNIQNTATGGMQAVGGVANQLLNPESYYNPGEVGQNLNNVIQGAGNAGMNLAQAAANKDNSIIEGLAKLNIGGTSLANTEGGKQLLKALELKSKMESEAMKAGGNMLSSYGQGTQDLLSGNITEGLAGISGVNGMKSIADQILKGDVGKVAGNVGNAVGNAVDRVTSGFGAGETGNWDPSRYKTTDAVTGQTVRIGEFANKSSADILKQMLSQQQLDRTFYLQNNQGNEGGKAMDRLLQYYNQALARENASKKK